MWINNYLKIEGLIKKYMQKIKNISSYFFFKKTSQTILKSSKCWNLVVRRLHMWFCLFFLGKPIVLNEFEFEKCDVSSAFYSYFQSHKLSLSLFYEFKLPEDNCVLKYPFHVTKTILKCLFLLKSHHILQHRCTLRTIY